ncbi:spermidine synthase [Bradyrhizobium sp. HKCCYLS1011]|uniref:spermine/spermidine synthase domain-containing protein n=1 Tax=Bradyrhizobium sp. HKCCYLS1011 TaxID=3420733 RepID=UPI003EB80074
MTTISSDTDRNSAAPQSITATGLATEASARHTSPASWALIPIVTASGFAGLGYEIVWTRQLSLALGTEMMAVLGSVAGFFAGLALGAFALDGLIRRTRSPARVYAALETVIGLWGVFAVWLLPAAGRTLAPLLGTEPAPVLLWAASFALPTLALLPATIAMGGTLAALERITREWRGASRVSAGVYGANTAGAVAGTLASTFLLIPALGFSGTLLALACVNLLCALGALALGRTMRSTKPDVENLPRTIDSPRLTLTLFATGFLGIAFEMLVVRLAAQVLEDTVFTFAGLLAAYLLGTAAGGLIWQRMPSRARESGEGWLLGGTALACLATAFLVPAIPDIAEFARESGIIGELAVAMALFLVPSAAMGALFGQLAQRVRDQRGSLGWAVGINGAGAALAPLVTAQILIPGFGAWTALLPVALAYLLLVPVRRTALVWSAAPLLAALVLWLRPTPQLTRVPGGGSLLAMREGPMATASVVDDVAGTRYLEINGHFRMGGTSSARSDYRQATLPLLLHPAPKRALFLGIGTGATVIGAAHVPNVSVHGVELSREVVALLPYFANPAANDRMPPITVADARRYVVADQASYDVIVADLFHPALDGSGALYTTEHFAAVKRRLAPGGIFCQWLPLYQLDLPSLRAIIRSFLAIYPNGSAWLNHYSVRTPMLALIGPGDASDLDLNALAARLRDPTTRAVVEPLGFEAPIDLLGQYVGGPHALAAFAGEGPRNTDDYPFVSFDARRNVVALTAPPWSLLLSVIRTMQPDPAELLTQPDALSERLPAYWRARDRFLEAGAALPGDPRGKALIEAASPGLLEALRASPEFDPAYVPLMGMAKSLLGSDRAAAQQLLQAIAAAAPARREASELLAREFGR